MCVCVELRQHRKNTGCCTTLNGKFISPATIKHTLFNNVKSPDILTDCNQMWNSSTDFTSPQYQILQKSVQCEPHCYTQAGGWVDNCKQHFAQLCKCIFFAHLSVHRQSIFKNVPTMFRLTDDDGRPQTGCPYQML
jgi:hypothetical protein